MDNIQPLHFPKVFKILLGFTLILAWGVIVLGAYTRLTNAGLGCPDWPGCYGHWIVEAGTLDPAKAWTEMIHRYFAGTLGLIILGLTISTYVVPRLKLFRSIMTLIAVIVIFQAALGMWTVTWKLHPTVVMGHLLGGMSIFGLLCFANLRAWTGDPPPQRRDWMRYALGIGVFLVFLQIALGGWTSANYAAVACTDFPACRGEMWPVARLSDAFTLIHPIGVSYEGGALEHELRVTIHFIHRMGAMIVLFAVGALAPRCLPLKGLYGYSVLVLASLSLQVALGISNVTLLLPLSVAVAHNGVAALLLGAVIALYFRYSRWSGE